MNRYTESDYKWMHQGIVEDIIDSLIAKWHESTCPLKARVCRNLASELEAHRVPEAEEHLRFWVSAANEEYTHKRSKS